MTSVQSMRAKETGSFKWLNEINNFNGDVDFVACIGPQWYL